MDEYTTLIVCTFISDLNLLKDSYIKIGFKEVSIGKDPEQIVFYDDMKCICRQYGLCYCVTRTIHIAIVDTYNHMII